ncbi:gastrula zinc finger protein XlCGF62.1-like [Diprion similis]|uniref:gastrula zinc finger protein XlCGF62.1-like n=1 Tax=Diprion similis TaxID=362088 RepID=UPI001EF7E26A|nr:gastrula zinc finger protein XlCGF62.1-like [Diprion similis]
MKLENDPISTEVKSESNIKACEICNEKFHFVTRLVAHLRIAHGIQKPFKCTSCWRTYAQQFMLNAHVKKSHTPKNISCDQCKFICVTNADLERHRKKQHVPKVKFYCEVCCETFTDEEQFVTHTAIHNFIDYQQCNRCSITFNDVESLKEHHRLYHFNQPAEDETEDSKHKCKICGMAYKFKSVLKQHKLDVHGIPNYERPRRRYLCALCGKELKTAKGFQIHNRSHTGEKPYTCEVCGKCFACETLLRTHNVTHTGERKYTCDQCGKSFTQRSTLVVHKRYHTGERPYVCQKCNKGFVTRTVLNTHLKSCH